jgi:conjugative transfer pilus assembly protein TraH
MDDFMTSAGAAANATPASVMQGQAGTFITGGSAVWRVPNKSFTPFSFTPPSYKRGCGGIDLYGGSIGFVNGEEFINYLRGIIQTSMGSIFISALDALAPGLSKTMQAISQDVQRMNSVMGSTCQMSQLLNNKTGIENDVNKWVQNATGQTTSDGSNSDFFSGYQRFKESLPDVLGTLKNSPSAKNSGGVTQTGPRNAMWAALHSGNFSDLSSESKNIALSLIGTRITRIEGEGANAVAVSENLNGTITIEQLAGSHTQANSSLSIYDCGDSAVQDPCLDLKDKAKRSLPFVPYARQYYNHLAYLRNAIINRQDPLSTEDGRKAVTALGSSRLGAFRLIELTSSTNLAGVSGVLLAKYADLMGWEKAVSHIETICDEIRISIDSVKEQGINATNKEDIELLDRRRIELLATAREYRKLIDSMNGSQADIVNELTHLERTLYNSFNLRMANNLRTARRS